MYYVYSVPDDLCTVLYFVSTTCLFVYLQEKYMILFMWMAVFLLVWLQNGWITFMTELLLCNISIDSAAVPTNKNRQLAMWSQI